MSREFEPTRVDNIEDRVDDHDLEIAGLRRDLSETQVDVETLYEGQGMLTEEVDTTRRRHARWIAVAIVTGAVALAVAIAAVAKGGSDEATGGVDTKPVEPAYRTEPIAAPW